MTWLIAAILFLVYMNAPAVAVRMHGAPFLVAAVVPMALAIPVAHRVLILGEPIRFPRALIAAFFMLALQAVSSLFSIRPFESIEFVQTWLLEGVLLAFLIANAIRTREELRASIIALVAAGAVMGAIALVQQLAGAGDFQFFGFGQFDSTVSDGEGRIAKRLAGPIGETNRFAQIMAVLIPIAASLALFMKGRARAAAWVSVGLICSGMVFAFSRGAIVALVLAVPFAIGFRILKWRQIVVVGVMALLVIAVVPQFARRVMSIGEVAVQSISLAPGGMRNADGAARGRMTEMKAAGLLFMEHPVLGAGPGMAPHYYEEYASIVGGKVRAGNRRSHNLYLQLAAEMGLMGLAVFALMLTFSFMELERARRRFETTDRQLWALACGLELALVISLTTSLFLHAAYIRYFWILIGLSCAATAQPGTPALVAFLARALRETADRIRRDQARA